MTVIDPSVAIVVPCYNEADRLDEAELLRIASTPGVELILVDDGSTDDTAASLERLSASASADIAHLGLEANQGKAEAVRQGLLVAIRSAGLVGYLDADLSTPVDEMIRLIETQRAREVEVLLGSRVALAGRSILRNPFRHYLGRVFATIAASYVLRHPIYDTQCGAKLFVNTGRFQNALESPFRSRWAFDVELLGRLLEGNREYDPLDPDQVREEPLEVWADTPGSKISPVAMVISTLELFAIKRRLGKWSVSGAVPETSRDQAESGRRRADSLQQSADSHN